MSRLIVIRKVIELVEPLLVVKSTGIPKDSNNHKLSGILNAQNGLLKLKQYNLFEDEIQELQNTLSFFDFASDEMIVDQNMAGQIRSKISAIRNNLVYSKKLLLQIAPEEKNNSIIFKLPSNITLDVLSDLFDDLNKALEQLIVNETIQGKIEFHGFESGSSWINVGLGTGTALMLICNIVNLVYDRKERAQRIETINMMNNDLKMSFETKEDIVKKYREQIDLLHQQELQKIRDDFGFPEDDHEMPKRLEHAVQKLEKWMNLGLEIHPSLAEPKETQIMFPDAQPFLDSIKLLASGSDDSES